MLAKKALNKVCVTLSKGNQQDKELAQKLNLQSSFLNKEDHQDSDLYNAYLFLYNHKSTCEDRKQEFLKILNTFGEIYSFGFPPAPQFSCKVPKFGFFVSELYYAQQIWIAIANGIHDKIQKEKDEKKKSRLKKRWEKYKEEVELFSRGDGSERFSYDFKIMEQDLKQFYPHQTLKT